MLMKKAVKWPPKSSEFLETLESSKPLQCIYNAIVWSINLKRKINENGYVETCNLNQAENTSAIMQCWENIISNTRSPTKTAFSLTLHRITESGEATDLLHRCGMRISYTDVRLLSNTCAKGITQNYKMILKKQFSNNESVQVSFDNFDDKQQTLTGYPTTHHTTGTIHQPNNGRNNEKAFYLE